MLQEAIDIAHDIGEQSGCNFLSVEALWSSWEFYRDYGFKWKMRESQYLNMLFKLGELDQLETYDDEEDDEKE